MATPVRNLQMGFASPVGPSALRHGEYRRRKAQIADFTCVCFDGASYVLLQILSGGEKQRACCESPATRKERFDRAGFGF